jgi:phage terminase large subunit
MQIEATIVFQKNWSALSKGVRFVVNQGGSRSSKTYSLCQVLILWCLQNERKVVSVVRKTFPALRASVMRDFFEVLQNMGIYSKESHNKSEHIYTFDNGTIVEFFSVDDEQKVRGRKRDIAWCNEANELWYEDFQQLNFRTNKAMIFDYNPSDSDSWLYTLPDADKVVIKSTYKDNPFLEKSIVKQIEGLKDTDEELYQIYALGEQAVSRENVYRPFEVLDERPDRFTQFVYGLDFGYIHPTALLKIWHWENEVYIEELIYESYLTSADLIARMDAIGVDRKVEIVADYARPEMIAELRTEGYYVLNADKRVEKGINAVKTTKVYLDKNAKNVQRENKNYKYKKVAGDLRDDVAKRHDDAMDAIRYGVLYIKSYSVSDEGETFNFSL